MAETYDLIVIGAGPGGYSAALRAASHGLKTAVVESREAGGTCVNRGCVPTKALLHASGIVREAANGATFGIHIGDMGVDPVQLGARRQEIAQTLSQGVESLFKGAKVALRRGTAQLSAPHTVTVTAADSAQEELTAPAILLATGSVPARPPIPGLTLPGVVTSDELLEGPVRLPSSLVIIGGGVIGVEFATFYAEMGCAVTVLEGLEHLLPALDRDLGQNLAQLLKKQGVSVATGAMVEAVEEAENGLTVRYRGKTGVQTAQGELVLCAIGRRPYTDGLFTADFTPAMDGRFVKVDERFATSLPGVYAIGDVACRVQLAHVASAQGIAFADLLAGKDPGVRLDLVPSCVYCHPEIASVGLSEAAAKEAGIPVKAGRAVMGANARSLIAAPGRSFMKLVAREEDGVLLGAQLMCEHASDMISQFSLAIAKGLSVRDLRGFIRPHPTFEEAAQDALSDLSKKLGL